MKLSGETADRLLDKLSSDDDFRAKFAADPRQALADVGHAPAKDPNQVEGAWTCMQVSSLASKEAIRNGRDELRRMLVASSMGHQPISLQTQRR